MVLRGKVFVLLCLAICSLSAQTNLTLRSDAGFFVATRDESKQKKVIKESIELSIVDGSFYIDGRPVGYDVLLITPIEGALYQDDKRYTNTVAVSKLNDEFSIVPMAPAKQYQKPEKTFEQEKVVESLPDAEAIPKVSELKKDKPITIRVLLAQLESDGMWKLDSPGGFVIWDPKVPQKKWRVNRESLLFVRKGKDLYLDGKKFTHDRLYIRPQVDYIKFEGNSYDGGFLINDQGDKSLLINCLDIEQYVFSVLRTESWPGWPLEVNKVCAIASRSYVISMVMRAKKTKQPYHVRNTNVHQTYTGVHDCSVRQQAVDETRGIFLSYEDTPIIAMFDTCCGGVIPAHISDFNFAGAPYLAREYACTFCKKCRLYAWEAECDLHQFEKKITATIGPIARVRDVRVTKKDNAGLVKEVMVKNAVRPLTVTGKRLYSMMDDVKSCCFNVRKKGTKIVFSGRGRGHHMGLCQWGAREMVRDGYNYKQILSFYYPGTEYKKLK